MKTYSKDEILNRHGQPIYYFSKQSGNTELEKCINFINKMGTEYSKYDVDTTTGTISIILEPGYLQVFNSIGEKVGEYEIDEEYSHDITEILGDMGFDLI